MICSDGKDGRSIDVDGEIWSWKLCMANEWAVLGGGYGQEAIKKWLAAVIGDGRTLGNRKKPVLGWAAHCNHSPTTTSWFENVVDFAKEIRVRLIFILYIYIARKCFLISLWNDRANVLLLIRTAICVTINTS